MAADAAARAEADRKKMEEDLKKGSSDLRYLLQQQGVKDVYQARLFTAQIDSLAKFAAFAASEEDLQKVTTSEFTLDPTVSLENRAQAASLTVAWQAARVRVKRQAEAEAVSEVREWAKPIPSSDYISMRKQYVARFGELEDKATPAKEYLEKKLQELESGEYQAEVLSEVISRDETDPDVLVPVWDR